MMSRDSERSNSSP